MTYVYICNACAMGDHDHCEGTVNQPPKNSEILGGGHCVCPHDAIYSSPNDVWRKQKAKQNGHVD